MTDTQGPIRTFIQAITRNGISLAGAALTTAAAILLSRCSSANRWA